jgi:hypothetical protein
MWNVAFVKSKPYHTNFAEWHDFNPSITGLPEDCSARVGKNMVKCSHIDREDLTGTPRTSLSFILYMLQFSIARGRTDGE